MVFRNEITGVAAQHAVQGLRIRRYDGVTGDMCSILTRRHNDQVELMFHSDPSTGAILTDDQARAVGQALIDAAGAR